LTAKTKYGGTVTNVKRKRVPGGGSGYSKMTRNYANRQHIKQNRQTHKHRKKTK